MLKTSAFFLCLITCYALPGLAQKVKYKDVFTLLSTRQYEASEPYLKQYLKENDDNPNAFLYMGIIYQEKSLKDDILKKTDDALNHMDSAIYFFDKAYKTIDEKELRKNKDYYAMYFRRDLRTGEYGVKISDVQFEVEKSKETLGERIDKVKMVKHYFTQAETLYKRSNELYLQIQSAYPGERELYLRADENSLKRMAMLATRFDSCNKAFEHYKVSLSNISKPGYNQTWNLLEIKNFKEDGVQLTDFYESNLQIWDYKSFASEVKSVVEKELMPVREKLIKFDIEINKLRERLATDSISVRSDLTKLVDNLLAEKLNRFDANPLPLSVLALKVAKLEYQSVLVEHRKYRDSSDIEFKLNLVRNELTYLRKVDSLTIELQKRNIDEEAKNYPYFVSATYNNITLLKGYIRTEKDFADRERVKKEREIAVRSNALQWLVFGNDSIPLANNPNSVFFPILVEKNKYTAGISAIDTANTLGYFYTITPSRRPDIGVRFPVENLSANGVDTNSLKALVTADSGGNIHFVVLYSTIPIGNQYPVTIAKIYRSDGLSWSYSYNLNFMPKAIEYQLLSTDLVVKSDSELTFVLDKNGTAKE